MPTQRLVDLPTATAAASTRRGAHLATAIIVTLFVVLLGIAIVLAVTGPHVP